jgi:RHS repeat-associated protein
MTQRLARLLLTLALACLPGLAAAAEKLAFIRGTAVYGINGDGTGLQQLSQPPVGTRDFGPLRYSPNAAKIAFQRIDAQSIPQIWVMKADGTGPVQVSPAGVPSASFSWAPDGTRLAIVANFQLYLVNADGTGLRALTAAPNAVALPSFSPDGTRIAFGNAVGSAASQIYVINADGSGLANLSQTPANWDVEPVWSPDGAKIAFTRYMSAPSALTGDLYVMNPDGSGKMNLTSTRDTFGSVWSRDGRAIAFTRKTGASTVDLFTVAPTGGPMVRVTTNLQVALEAAWASDNSRLALSSGGDLFTVKPDGTGLTNITNAAAAQNLFPEYAPQPRPKQLYFIHPDHLNTPRLIADQNQQPVWRWDQAEPFGVNVPDGNPSGLGAFEFPLRFPGQYFDKETNLAYNYFRYFDSSSGRYIESDPLGLAGGLNTFSYVGSSPLSFVDPWGLAGICAGKNPAVFNPADFPECRASFVESAVDENSSVEAKELDRKFQRYTFRDPRPGAGPDLTGLSPYGRGRPPVKPEVTVAWYAVYLKLIEETTTTTSRPFAKWHLACERTGKCGKRIAWDLDLTYCGEGVTKMSTSKAWKEQPEYLGRYAIDWFVP